jgi:hypothetical protein
MATSYKPLMRVPVVTTFGALGSLAVYVVMTAAGPTAASGSLGILISGLFVVLLIALTVLQWVVYFHGYVQYQFDRRFPDKQGDA